MSDSNQNVETTSNSKLEFTELKDLFIKRMQKRIFSGRDHFRLWAFASTGEYFHYWYWRVLPKVLQGKWCQDLQDSYNHHFTLYAHKSYVYWAIPEKIQTGGLRIYFSDAPLTPLHPLSIPGIFRFVTLPLKFLEKTSFYPWKFCNS